MSAWRVKRKVNPGEVPVIRHVDDFPKAAASLATKTCAYVLPASIESPYAPVTNNQQKINPLLSALNKDNPRWFARLVDVRTVTPESDIGFHGNPPQEESAIVDYLQYHHTPVGSHELTFGLARDHYLDEMLLANPFLTDALREGKTFSRWANPRTFQRTSLSDGDSVVFRLNGEDGSCLLHDFRTTSNERVAEITGLARIHPLLARLASLEGVTLF